MRRASFVWILPDPAAAPAVSPHRPLRIPTHRCCNRPRPSIVSVFPAILVGADNPDHALERFFTPPADDKKKEGGDPNKPAERPTGSGSGVIISTDGFIVTNRHVIILPTGKPADSFKIELADKRQVPAKLIGMDTVTDLALLKVETPGLTAIPLADSDAVKTGDLVFAIGNPFRIGITATMGMVSATRRSTSDSPETLENYIQTDAAINPGNSGGALINASGRLIGINTAIYGNTTNAGIGFAIPTRLMKHVVENLATHGKVPRGFFGIQADNPASRRHHRPPRCRRHRGDAGVPRRRSRTRPGRSHHRGQCHPDQRPPGPPPRPLDDSARCENLRRDC